MPDFSKTRGFGGQGEGKLTIREERQFTDPHVRFVRIRGRIVPILNKNKLGRTASKAGNSMITAGAVLGMIGAGATVARRVQKKRVSKILANPRTAKIFNATRANSTMFKHAKTTGLSLSKIGRRSLIASAAVGLAGVAAKAVGFELKVNSPFGADLL